MTTKADVLAAREQYERYCEEQKRLARRMMLILVRQQQADRAKDPRFVDYAVKIATEQYDR